jgi:hypothetical protein
MRESVGGYTPGSLVWVPWSVARPQPRERREGKSWLSLLFRRGKRPSLYQRCLALHIMTTSRPEPLSTREAA